MHIASTGSHNAAKPKVQRQGHAKPQALAKSSFSLTGMSAKWNAEPQGPSPEASQKPKRPCDQPFGQPPKSCPAGQASLPPLQGQGASHESANNAFADTSPFANSRRRSHGPAYAAGATHA